VEGTPNIILFQWSARSLWETPTKKQELRENRQEGGRSKMSEQKTSGRCKEATTFPSPEQKVGTGNAEPEGKTSPKNVREESHVVDKAALEWGGLKSRNSRLSR